MSDEKQTELIKTACDRFQIAVEAEGDNRRDSLADIKFAAGDDKNLYQWDDEAQKSRAGRPMLTINKLPKFRAQVINSMRQDRFSIKVRPSDSNSDTATADILEGLIRNIEYNSTADVAYDTAAAQAVDGGFGYFRILTDYCDDDSFDQEIRIERIKNQFTVYLDPTAQKHDCSDGKFAFITEWMDREEFKTEYPDVDPLDFAKSGIGDDDDSSWHDSKKIRVAEYYYKEAVTATIYQLATGEVISSDQLPEDATIVENNGKWLEMSGADPVPVIKERAVKTHKVMWCKMAGGSQIVEGPIEQAGKYIPIVRVIGEELVIEGKTILRGLFRYVKDPQRIYNYMRSADVEMTALAPKVPFLATKKQIGPYLQQWKTANSLPYPFLLFDPDPNSPGKPSRSEPVTTQPGLAQNAIMSNDEMKDTVGLYDASLGKQSNETSGRAITARKQEGDTGTFNYRDNVRRSLVFAGKILVDLIPRVYDTERIIRVRGVDGTEAFVPINKTIVNPATGETTIINDITVGKYDCYVDTGPSYTSQRMEFLDGLGNILQYLPDTMRAVAAPKLISNMDWHGAQELADELSKFAPAPPPPPGTMPPQGAMPPGAPQLPPGMIPA